VRVFFDHIDGVHTRYYKAGAGDPVLLIHGVGVTADSWCRVLGPLSRGSTLVAPDLLGSGFTEPGRYTGGPPHEAMLDHLEALIEKLGWERFTLVGSSFGAVLSTLLYFRLRERVSKLVLVSSGSMLMGAVDLVQMYRRSYANGRMALEDPSFESCRRRLANIFYDAAAIPEAFVLQQLTSNALPSALPAFEQRLRGMQDLEAMRTFTVVDRLEEIAIPTLAVWGRQDPRGPYALAEQHIPRIAGARLVAFDRCGHLPHLEQSEAFVETVREFLDGDSLQSV